MPIKTPPNGIAWVEDIRTNIFTTIAIVWHKICIVMVIPAARITGSGIRPPREWDTSIATILPLVDLTCYMPMMTKDTPISREWYMMSCPVSTCNCIGTRMAT